MNKIATVFIVLFVLVAIAFATCLKIVPMDRVGIRSDLFGAGLEERDLKPGLWLVVPGMHKLEIMDPTLQELSFGQGTPEGVLDLRTQDQYSSKIDVTVFYRIRPNFAWDVRKNMGPGLAFQERFRQQAVDVIWNVIGKMRTEDLYDSEKREAAATETVKKLGKQLSSLNLEVKNLLIRKVVFDPQFEGKLIINQLLGQQKLLSQSLTKHVEQKQITDLIKKETIAQVIEITEEKNKKILTLTAAADATIRKIEAGAEKTVLELMSGAERQRREMAAAGDLEKTLAEAKGQKAINEAYQSKGGQLLLSRKMVENFKIGRIEVNTSLMNPFDVQEFLRLVGAVTTTESLDTR